MKRTWDQGNKGSSTGEISVSQDGNFGLGSQLSLEKKEWKPEVHGIDDPARLDFTPKKDSTFMGDCGEAVKGRDY